MKILISNLVYGEPYTEMFCNYHLNSVINNLIDSEFSKESLYLIYTDGKNIKNISTHVNFNILNNKIKTKFVVINQDINYDQRYSIQGVQLSNSIEVALNGYDFMIMTSADTFYGPSVFRKYGNILKNSEIKAIWGIFFRTTFEPLIDYLYKNKFPNKEELFQACINYIHPLWVHADWDVHRFTKIPYQMLWSSHNQIIVRGYSWSPLIFRPEPWMSNASGSIDLSFDPTLISNYWITEWWELPIIELVQLKNFYPPFGIEKANVKEIAKWTVSSIPKRNWDNLKRSWLFKHPTEELDIELVKKAEAIANKILTELIISR